MKEVPLLPIGLSSREGEWQLQWKIALEHHLIGYCTVASLAFIVWCYHWRIKVTALLWQSVRLWKHTANKHFLHSFGFLFVCFLNERLFLPVKINYNDFS